MGPNGLLTRPAGRNLEDPAKGCKMPTPEVIQEMDDNQLSATATQVASGAEGHCKEKRAQPGRKDTGRKKNEAPAQPQQIHLSALPSLALNLNTIQKCLKNS